MRRYNLPGSGGAPEHFHFLTDDQHSVVALQRASDGEIVERISYSDYGAPLFENTDSASPDYGQERDASFYGNPYAFTGRRWEPGLQLYDYRFRWFDPSTGRFITRDPIGIWGDNINLGNGYTYVGNNPWTYVDPWGEQGCSASVPSVAWHHVIPKVHSGDKGYYDILDSFYDKGGIDGNGLELTQAQHTFIHHKTPLSPNESFDEFIKKFEDKGLTPSLDDFKEFAANEKERIRQLLNDPNINFPKNDYDKPWRAPYLERFNEATKKRIERINLTKRALEKAARRARYLKKIPFVSLLFFAQNANADGCESALENEVYSYFWVNEVGDVMDYTKGEVENSSTANTIRDRNRLIQEALDEDKPKVQN
jgi:RHS repeat-associated protein